MTFLLSLILNLCGNAVWYLHIIFILFDKLSTKQHSNFKLSLNLWNFTGEFMMIIRSKSSVFFSPFDTNNAFKFNDEPLCDSYKSTKSRDEATIECINIHE